MVLNNSSRRPAVGLSVGPLQDLPQDHQVFQEFPGTAIQDDAAVEFECARRDFRRDMRIAIAVAAHP